MKFRKCLTEIAALLALAIVSAPLAVAGLVSLSQPSATGMLDGEASTNSVVCLTDCDSCRFRIRMSVNGNDYNCAMLEFGTDANGNGTLERNEVELAVGWDCGEWICRDRVNGRVSSVARPAGLRKLDWLLYLRGDSHAPFGLVARDGDALFQDMPIQGLFKPSWNLARLVTRGGSPLESASVKHFPAPFIITIR